MDRAHSDTSLLETRVTAPEKGRAPWLQLGLGNDIEWNHLQVPVQHLPALLQGLRILHLSDSHLQARWHLAYDRFLARLAIDPPDLVLFTGDIVDEKLDHRATLPIVKRFVTQLSSRLGVYAIAGNHDGDLLGPRLAAWNVQYIDSRFVRLEANHAAIELIGLPGVRRTNFDPNWVMNLPAHSPGVPRIVLGHYPDQVRHIASLRADLMLSGHTHGGQICLPGGRALMTHDSLPRHMARGAHRFNHTLLVVNRGFGMTRWPIRVFCPAEVVELRLTQSMIETIDEHR